ncbi:hypothetical protein VC34_19385 [Pseudomonas fluorescens]|uniref:Uncharacterized protein n=1 Tax=Pseudomonas fluorescens TaxID=294 RepID=A0A0F4TEW4_PSEFL|nr:hypothetical protein VC34_19385 [Pseudomonas fluorescens]
MGCAALWMAYVVRLGVDEMVNPFKVHLWLFLFAAVVAIPLFVRFGMYRTVMRYFGNDALIAIIKAVRQILRETVSGYTPDGDIVDWIYQQRRLEP